MLFPLKLTPSFYLEPFSSYRPFNGVRLYFFKFEYRRSLTIIDAFFLHVLVILDNNCNLTISIQNVVRLFIYLFMYSLFYIRWPFPPVWGVADNTKEQQKQWGPHSVPLAMTRDPAEFGWHCWSTTAHPPPSFTTYVASQMPSPLLPLPQGCPYKQPRGNNRCQ